MIYGYPPTMGILDRWRTTRDLVRAAETIDVGRPVVPPAGGIAPSLTDAMGLTSYGSGLGWWAPGARVGRDIAMSVPAVRRGVNLIAGTIAAMPLRRWRGEQLVPEISTFLAQPEASRAYVTTLTLTVQDLVLYPYAWWKVEARDWTGRPSRVVRLDPKFVTVEKEWESGVVVREYIAYQGREVPQADLIRFDGPDAGLLELGAGEIITALRLEMAAQVYASPEVPTGYLKNTGEYALTRLEIDELLSDWSVGRARSGTAFVNRNVDYQAVMSTPQALQLVEGREESVAQIARLIGVPARLLNAKEGSSLTYSTTWAERDDFVDTSLNPYLLPIQQRLSMDDANGTPAGTAVRFDVNSFRNLSPREQAELDEIEIRSGVLTVAEARARRGLEPITPEVTRAPSAA